eukprot:2980657-Pleurochrysis_carterae.AAC.8
MAHLSSSTTVCAVTFAFASAPPCKECEDCDTCPGKEEVCGFTLPPKNEIWPPTEILQKKAGPNAIEPQFEAELEWWRTTVLEQLPKDRLQSDTEYALTVDELKLVNMTLVDWIAARKAGTYTCEAIAVALTKRAKYMQVVV